MSKAARRGRAPILHFIVGAVAAALFGGAWGADATALSRHDVACPRTSEAPNLPLRPGGGRLRGDVDGDRYPDRVSLRYSPTSRASCGFLLVVKTRSRLLAVRVPEWYKPPHDLRIRDWPFAEPFLGAVVQLHARRLQIVVARWHGAAVVNVSLYGIVGGKLVLLHFHPRIYQDELGLFGTVGTGVTNVRCARRGPLILLSKGPTSASGMRWFVSRSEYQLIGDHFWRARARTIRSSMKRIDAIAHRWGIDALPFAGCTVARGRHL